MKRKHELGTCGLAGPRLREAEQIIAIIHRVVQVPLYLRMMYHVHTCRWASRTVRGHIMKIYGLRSNGLGPILA
jgi:hypothetical protein